MKNEPRVGCPIPRLLLPSHAGAGGRGTFGWLTSTAISALLVSAIGAFALAVQEEAGDAVGDHAEPVLIMLAPTPAVEAMAEPSPDVLDQAPSEKVDAPDIEDTPDTPEMTEAPEIPDAAPVIEEAMVEDMPEIDTETPPAPAEVAVPKPVEKPVEKLAEKKPEPPKEKPKEKPKKKAEKPVEKKAESKKPAKKKASEASAASKAASSNAKAAASTGSGKASAASYGAQVMKKVSRTKKKSTGAGARGTALVTFTISDSGALAGVRISKTSGSASVDEVALDHIRRSAPFPPPPAGADRTFSFNFKAR